VSDLLLDLSDGDDRDAEPASARQSVTPDRWQQPDKTLRPTGLAWHNRQQSG
jgi:hypothetical protein